jgi:hypothetical protein
MVSLVWSVLGAFQTNLNVNFFERHDLAVFENNKNAMFGIGTS